MEISGEFGRDGILLIDKPSGPTSHDVVAAVRKLVRPRRVGHTGTLDPLATGLLILCIGKATRIASILEAEYKEYRASVLLGVRTDTQDIEGTVVNRQPVGQIASERIKEAAHSFVGWIEQRPPAFSAVKVDGVRSYKMARQGKAVALKSRRVEIRKLVIERIHLPTVDFIVECSKGTYVRTLCSDIGDMLGVGGCMEQLRRLKIGRLSLTEAIALSQLRETGDVVRKLLPLSQALEHLPKLICTEEQAARVAHGERILIEDHSQPDMEKGWICAIGPGGAVLAVGKAVAEGAEFFFQPKKVLVCP